MADRPSSGAVLDVEAVRGQIEAELCRIVAAVLGREAVGAGDNLFDLGGASTHALEVVDRARAAGLPMVPADLFETDSLAEVAGVLLRSRGTPHLTPARSPWHVIVNDSGAATAHVVLPTAEDIPWIRALARREELAGASFHVTAPSWDESRPYVPPGRLAGQIARAAGRTAAPGGHVVLGQCVAGIVAARVAVRLQREGGRISRVVLLNTAVPGRAARRVPLDKLLSSAAAEHASLRPVLAELVWLTRLRDETGLRPDAVMKRLWSIVRPALATALGTRADQARWSVDPERWGEPTLQAAAASFMGWANLVVSQEVPMRQRLQDGTRVDLLLSDPRLDEAGVEAARAAWARSLGGTVTAHHVPGRSMALVTSDTLAALLQTAFSTGGA